jgi:hypothetical protein
MMVYEFTKIINKYTAAGWKNPSVFCVAVLVRRETASDLRAFRIREGRDRDQIAQ